MVNLKNIEYNLKPIKRTLSKIKEYDYADLGDNDLLSMSQELKNRAQQDEPEAVLIPETFALVFEAVKRTLGFATHDNQLLAAAAMANGAIIELATGEGKTLAAVFTASLKALSGKGVHVLTFNDYLAGRDAQWMKPVYEKLGLSVGFVGETTNTASRRLAYDADITYVTAKEAGFDYLRGFLAFSLEEMVQRPFHFAVIDEADSILIDEARIPLVIAGDMPVKTIIGQPLYRVVAKMQEGVHFETDENGSVIYLEDAGIACVEEQFQIDNLYDEKNLELLSNVNIILQAEHLLHKDVDYIIKNGELLLVDEFTGRIAHNRQWSEGLHTAVEIKEGLTPAVQGQVMNSITLQNFIRLYPDFCGMTGTARPAAAELLRFYDKNVTVIPPDKPCRRLDHPDVIFTHKQAKVAAVVSEVLRAYEAGRPVLLGTSSIEESEQLADLLCGMLPDINVLNAKNDEAEADIIANAGRRGAVTISTNMAGRGVDIRLGGENEEDGDAVRALGGLYVIGTNRHQSVRVDNQLRGRSGRQGDPGESRFFISLEDDLVVRYGLIDSIPEKYRQLKQTQPLENSAFKKAVIHTQKVVEGQMFDAKVTLFKYADLVEDQRFLVHKKREQILHGEDQVVLEREDPELYEALLHSVTDEELRRAERQITLYAVNTCWTAHLLFLDSLQNEVQMIGKIKGDPLTHYNKNLIMGYESMQEDIGAKVAEIFRAAVIKEGQFDLAEMGIRGPTSTRTYMVHDGTEGFGLFGGSGDIAAAAFAAPLYLMSMLAEKLKKRRK